MAYDYKRLSMDDLCSAILRVGWSTEPNQYMGPKSREWCEGIRLRAKQELDEIYEGEGGRRWQALD